MVLHTSWSGVYCDANTALCTIHSSIPHFTTLTSPCDCQDPALITNGGKSSFRDVVVQTKLLIPTGASVRRVHQMSHHATSKHCLPLSKAGLFTVQVPSDFDVRQRILTDNSLTWRLTILNSYKLMTIILTRRGVVSSYNRVFKVDIAASVPSM